MTAKLFKYLKSSQQLLTKKTLLLIFVKLLQHTDVMGVNGEAQVLSQQQAPQFVRVEKIHHNAFTVAWKIPVDLHDRKLKLLAFSVLCFPVGNSNPAEERQITLPPSATYKEITGLREGTKYEVSVTAVYTGNQRMAAPSLVLKTESPFISSVQEDHVLSGQSLFVEEPECNCSEPGTAACTRIHNRVKCTCFPGYTGIWCDQCASGYFLDKKMCKDCPCTNTTSSGKCILDESGEVKCESCLAGHRGHFCSSCTAGYRWNNISCVPLNCLSFTLCMKQMDHPGCSDCIYLMDSLSPPTAQKSSERTIADGTVPLIAVIVTLGIILLVAAGATCYRSWVHWRARPRLPLWEMELGEVKNTLGYHSICKINDNNIHHISSEVEEEDLTDYTHSAVS